MTNSRALTLAALLLCSEVLAGQDNSALNRFELLIEHQDYQHAAEELEPYTAAHPTSWQALYQLGYAEFRLHHIQASLTALCKSLIINKDAGESHKILAYDLNILGHQAMAIHELEEAIRCNPSSQEAHYELGRICYEQKSYLRSVEELEKAESLDPASVRVYHNLGLAYSAIGQTQKAVDSFETGLRLNAQQNQQSAWPFIDYATYLNMESGFERARDLLLRAIQIDPSYDQAYSELAKAYRGLGKSSDAIAALQRAIAINANNPEYHYVLARLYTQTARANEAKQELAAYERCKAPAGTH